MLPLARVLELTAISIIFLFGVVFNCVVLRSLVLARRYHRRCGSPGIKNECLNVLVMNLAATDLFILLISIPMDVIPEHMSWPYGLFVCKFISPIQDVCLTASALTFTAIATERYLVSEGKTQKRHVKLILVGIWTISWLTMGLPIAIYKNLIKDDERMECDVIWPNKYVANFFLYYMIVLIGACAMAGATAYCRIRQNLAKVHREFLNKPTINNSVNVMNDDDSLREQTLRLSNLICVLITAFVICVLPFPLFVVFIETDVLVDFQYNYVIYLVTSCLLYGNCLANPLILMFMSRDARMVFNERGSATRRCNTENVPLENV